MLLLFLFLLLFLCGYACVCVFACVFFFIRDSNIGTVEFRYYVGIIIPVNLGKS